MSQTGSSGRIHALDNLRAIMMWLGIVLHVCVNHLNGPSQLPWRDPQTSQFADLTLLFIHAFRMPVFFILAGYLAAMMVDTRGVRDMVRNRLRRIALPFAVFWPVLFILMVVLVLVFAHLMARGTIGLDLAVAPKKPAGGVMFATMHMWFVYYLFWFSMLGALLVAATRVLPESLQRAWRACWDALLSNWWGLIVLALPLALVGAGYRAGMLAPSGSFVPNVRELVHSGVFFVFGWQLYRHRATLLDKFSVHYAKYLLAGLVTFGGALVLFGVFIKAPDSIARIELWIAFTYGLTSWLWSVGLLGLFLRHLDRQNAVLRYVSDSSYWVFLVHMLGTMGFGILLFNAPLGALAKITLNVLATSALCLASYQLFVRRTWIGVLLNGKRAPRTPAPLQPAIETGIPG
jgi:glucans biosynthesis protein C